MKVCIEHPNTVIKRINEVMGSVDREKEVNLLVNATSLVIEYNDKNTGYKRFDDVASLELVP